MNDSRQPMNGNHRQGGPDKVELPALARSGSLPISGVVIAMNEADRIARCISSMITLCSEVIILDSGSTDDTVARATAAGARVEHQQWLGFSGQKNAAIALARNPWVLLLDADEWLAAGAEQRLRSLFETGRLEHADAWRLQRRTHFLGKALRFGGWGREAMVRLFRSHFRYLPARVHERLDLSGARIAGSSAGIEHDTARTLLGYREKLEGYALLFAEQQYARGKRATVLSPLWHASFYVLKNVLLRGGFLDGPKAWRYHLEHTRYVWLKYRHLHALASNNTSTNEDKR